MLFPSCLKGLHWQGSCGRSKENVGFWQAIFLGLTTGMGSQAPEPPRELRLQRPLAIVMLNLGRELAGQPSGDDTQPRHPSSFRRDHAGTPSAFANREMLSTDTFRVPLSTSLT